jgi:hypothetical protein
MAVRPMGIEGNGDAFLMQRGPEMVRNYVRDLTGASLSRDAPFVFKAAGSNNLKQSPSRGA